MSADFISSIGNRPTHQIPPAVTPRPAAEAQSTPIAPQLVPETTTAESFSVSSEAREAPDAAGGWAAQFMGAWGGEVAPPEATAGQLRVEGAENTSHHAVHGANNGAYRGSEQEAGFTAAPVYSSRPPGA